MRRLHLVPRVPRGSTKALRNYLRKRDGDCCCWCGCLMNFSLTGNAHQDNDATIEHLVSKCQGGKDTDENLRLACRKCNSTRLDHNGLPIEGRNEYPRPIGHSKFPRFTA